MVEIKRNKPILKPSDFGRLTRKTLKRLEKYYGKTLELVKEDRKRLWKD